AEAAQQQRLAKEAGDVYDMAIRATYVRSTFLPAIELLPSLGQIFVLAYGGHLVLRHALSLGTLIMFNFYVILLVNPLRMLGQIIAQAERAAAAGDRAAQVLAIAPAIVDAERPLHLPTRGQANGEVRFSGVSFRFGGKGSQRILNQLDLHVPAGQSVAI